MRIWIRKAGKEVVQVNFQPDSEEESKKLDEFLAFKGEEIPVFSERDKTVADGASKVGTIGGHETQRWVSIPINFFLKKQQKMKP